MSFPSGKVLRCQQWKVLFLIIFPSSSCCSLAIEISAVFSNASCLFFLIFIFRKRGFRLFFSLEAPFSYLLDSYIYSLFFCYPLFILFECLSSICIIWAESCIFLHVCSITFSIFLFSPLQPSGIQLSQTPQIFKSQVLHQQQHQGLWGSRIAFTRLFIGFVLMPFAGYLFPGWIVSVIVFSVTSASQLRYIINTEVHFMAWLLLLTVDSDNGYSE